MSPEGHFYVTFRSLKCQLFKIIAGIYNNIL
nr:MAG TPA: hypothetical protein [Caudoviricetes sp.]